MANTASGFIAEGTDYDKILYVSQDRLEELKGKLKDKKKGTDITKEDVKGLMYPEDMDDDSMLVPVDVSAEGDHFPTTYQELLAKVQPKEAVAAMVKAAQTFEKSKKKFSDSKRPIPMSVGDWMTQMSIEEGAEEDAEEEDLEQDEVVEPSPLKKRKKF
mmetsp:Transcript_21119/g.39698  ORF Transcript_21119/g.39698 Transcript_21119/m.39698 type:complete len:159 (-) Transcript_21119:187-663(-)